MPRFPEEMRHEDITQNVFEWKRSLSKETREIYDHGTRKSLYEAAHICGIITDAELDHMKNYLGKLWDYVGD